MKSRTTRFLSVARQAAFVLAGCASSWAAATPSPHSFYNTGVKKMAEKDLREAEVALRSAVASNHETIQPAALYNLGHVRFLQGKETLKGEGNRQQLLDSSAAATALAEEVIRRSAPIAEREDVQQLINAYMEARAARRQLRVNRDETTRELDLLGSAVQRWRRSVGDFRSAAELKPERKDAAFNADVVERHIDELLKYKKQLEEQQSQVGQQREKLKEMMKKMRGKIPKEMQRGSDEEEDDEDEEEPQEEKGEKETAKQQQQRIGGEREIDPDMLRVLKEKMPQRTMSVGQEGEREAQGFRPDGKPGEPKEPKGRKGRDW
jgi:hypothetical protein